MKSGILISAVFYLTGLALAWLSYITLGHEYIHGPGFHHLLIFLTFVGGFLWLCIAAIRFFTGPKTEKLKGIIFTNLTMSVGFTLFMVYIIYGETMHRNSERDADEVTIEEAGDTITMFRNGSPVYVKVKDSVLINFIDSTRVNWEEVKRIKK